MFIDQKLKIKDLAGIEYYGTAGITARCLRVLTMAIQAGDTIEKAYLLSDFDNKSGCGTHCFLLFAKHGDPIAIKSGFASGYSGEGPRGLSSALQILIRHNIDIEEYDIDKSFIERVDSSCLTQADLEMLEAKRPARPTRFYGFILLHDDHHLYDDNLVKGLFAQEVPYHIVDNRIMKEAIDLKYNPDANLMTCYRRLEDIIRKRTGLDGQSGTKLFSQAFLNNDAPLHWPDLPDAEAKGLASLFSAVYMAYRNSRAHKENETTPADAMREFLLINQLFILESEAHTRQL
ncbi:TIGR02391 family protein [Rheinheimera sp. 1928-s]|uniref:TIGR02391 family protein n=1 Tax=Rheinheimera sp. 1928-s TaxID=3033803 RepID=UPI0026378796|nr:TIGR02391 family protein [Rheinheimera sp. 1928-s]MDF3123577.1 TIGR02391 family protein [Rheinheimera sp. 1928-s]